MNVYVLLVVITGTLYLGAFGLWGTTSVWERIMLVALLMGVMFYSGIGAAYSGMPAYYTFMYFVFVSVLVVSYRVTLRYARTLAASTSDRVLSLSRQSQLGARGHDNSKRHEVALC